MCGVLGVAYWANNTAKENISSAVDLIASRGPDDYGRVDETWYTAAHTRLSIQDTSWRGHQPFHEPHGRYVFVYNGEIYNFKALNDGLYSDGITLVSGSDTETLAHCFFREGTAAFANFQGMFAGGIFDREERALYLFRDRLGVKPLYFHADASSVAFASTPAAVSEMRGGLPIARDEYASCLAFRTPRADQTMFEGVETLKPGTVLKISRDGRKHTSFWSLSDKMGLVDNNMSPETALDATRAHLTDSVNKRLIADVTVGSFLSGGLDSTIVLHHMAAAMPEPVQTHSFASEDASTDEVGRAARTAERYGAVFTVTQLNEVGHLSDLEHLMRLKGAPLTVQNEYAIFKMSERMKQTNTVVLSGEGADEIFWGYSRIFSAAAQESNLANKTDIACWIFNHYRYVSPEALETFGYDPEHRRRYTEQGIAYVEGLLREFEDGDAADNLQYFFLRHHLPGLLQRLDNATMAASIEGRVPFTDHELIEFALTIPRSFKLAGPQSPFAGKRILYESYEHTLPEWVINTPKIGFKLGDMIRQNAEIRMRLKSSMPKFENWFDNESISQTERWHLTMAALFANSHSDTLIQ